MRKRNLPLRLNDRAACADVTLPISMAPGGTRNQLPVFVVDRLNHQRLYWIAGPLARAEVRSPVRIARTAQVSGRPGIGLLRGGVAVGIWPGRPSGSISSNDHAVCASIRSGW